MARTAGRRDVGTAARRQPKTIDSQVRLSMRPGVRRLRVRRAKPVALLSTARTTRCGSSCGHLGTLMPMIASRTYPRSSVGRSNRSVAIRWHDGDPEAGGPASEGLRGWSGSIGPDFNIVTRGRAGRLHLLVQWVLDYPLAEESPDTYRLPDGGLYSNERVTFSRDRTAGKDGVAGRRCRSSDARLPPKTGPPSGSRRSCLPKSWCARRWRRPRHGDGRVSEAGPDRVPKLDPDDQARHALRHHEQLRRTAFYKKEEPSPAPRRTAWCGRTGGSSSRGTASHSRPYRPWYVPRCSGTPRRGQACVRGEPGQRLAAPIAAVPSTSHSMTCGPASRSRW